MPEDKKENWIAVKSTSTTTISVIQTAENADRIILSEGDTGFSPSLDSPLLDSTIKVFGSTMFSEENKK